TGTDSLTARFDLGERLGGARTGAGHRAIDKTTGKPCGVKLVSPAVTALAGVAQRLERELKQLERAHSVRVGRVLATGQRPATGRAGFTPAREDEEYWVATELLEGAKTLAESITARGPVPVEQAA